MVTSDPCDDALFPTFIIREPDKPVVLEPVATKSEPVFEEEEDPEPIITPPDPPAAVLSCAMPLLPLKTETAPPLEALDAEFAIPACNDIEPPTKPSPASRDMSPPDAL